MNGKIKFISPLLVVFCLFSAVIHAQPSWTFNLFGNDEKPKQYEARVLPSEKTADRKFTLVRRFIQNNVTHYNYYFNANAKFNTIIERAKLAQKDDYTKLLSFYPYSLENTVSQAVELDSVIYKCTGGILLHDLRTDWVDNLYLLIGKSYFHRKLFDSAALTFQFINYNLFPRKKNEDDNRTIGGGSSLSGSMSIADSEKRNFLQKVFTLPPSRNDALVWIIRTFIEVEEYNDAAGMINLLQSDPNLPKRLKDDIDEMKAYWFFRQHIYDSAAVYLEKAITNVDSKPDKVRARYLLGQLFEMSRQYDKAYDYFSQTSKKTTEPLMDIYANLNQATMLRNSGDEKELSGSISNLLSMASKDKFESYRDIIYNSAAQLSLFKKDTLSAIEYHTKSLSYNNQNQPARNKAHLELGKIAYAQAAYIKAADHYDSIDVADPSISADSLQIVNRKSSLRKLADQAKIISHEDSVQRIALLPAAERDVFLKKLSKKLRKEKGGKEEDELIQTALLSSTDKNVATDLFQSASKGDWYFSNASMKSKGFGEFKAKWGKRENKDNWRRRAVMNIVVNDNINIDDPNAGQIITAAGDGKPVENSYDALLLGLPLTKENVDSSNKKIARALVLLGQIFDYDVEEYFQAIDTYNDYLNRFPEGDEKGDVYLGLYHCYTKLGDKQKAAYYKKLIETQLPGSKYSDMLSNNYAVNDKKKDAEATGKYQMIYDLFIEGNFDKAVAEKKSADSTYGKNYWTPQLLYIESIYFIKARKDSQAIVVLSSIVNGYPNTLMSEKASTMIEVVKKRNEIESYLTNLQVTRAEEGKMSIAEDKPQEVTKPVVPVVPPVKPVEKKVDSVKATIPVVEKKIDSVKTVAPVVTKKIDSVKTVPVVEKKIDTVKTIPVVTKNTDSVIIKSVIKDSIIKTPVKIVMDGYTWEPANSHVLVMVLNKVDAVYINEAKNALIRYNREKNYAALSIVRDQLDAENALLVFNSFDNVAAGLAYYDKLRKSVATEISWLQPSKYSFLIITNENLQILKTKKDKDNYKKLLNSQYPARF